jgi:hypothetical protein
MLVERPRLATLADSERANAEGARKRLAEVEQELNGRLIASNRVPSSEANLPLVMLEASRADRAGAVALPAGANRLAVWVEPPPAPAATKYRLEILREGGAAVESIDGLVRNSYGALAASLPASSLQGATYRARLYLSAGAKPGLVGEYRFTIQR